MDYIIQFFKKDITRKVLTFAIIAFVFYLIRGMLNVFLLTFLFTYIVYNLHSSISKHLGKYIKLHDALLTILLYIMFFVLLAIIISTYIPKIIFQCRSIIFQIWQYDLDTFTSQFLDKINPHLKVYIEPLYNQIDIKTFSKDSINILSKAFGYIGKVSLQVFFALILSLFFMLERGKIKSFARKFKDSKISWFYLYASQFFNSFVNSFGKVIQAQILIAITNGVLSVLGLWALGFRELLGFGVMVFVLSLIPVAGVLISLIPLSIMAFKIGGLSKVIYVLIMIALLHGLESYVLNPKFMSDKTNLPKFVVFIILMVSEEFMGVWGLILGIPLFIFILDLINVRYAEKEEMKEK